MESLAANASANPPIPNPAINVVISKPNVSDMKRIPKQILQI